MISVGSAKWTELVDEILGRVLLLWRIRWRLVELGLRMLVDG